MNNQRGQVVPKVGVFKKGWGKNAEGQKKKHIEQMSRAEKDYLAFLLKDLHHRFKIHPHLQDKQRKGLVSYDILTIKNTLRSPALSNYIREYSEVNRNDGEVDRRVLVRSPKKERVYIKNRGYRMCNLLFVISLKNSEVITAYYSHQHHTYETNIDRYDKHLAII